MIAKKLPIDDNSVDIIDDAFEDANKNLNMAFTLINQKLSEISNLKLTVANIILALAAVIVSLISLA